MNTEHLKSLTREAIAAINRGDIERAVSYTAPDCTLNGEPYGRAGDRMRGQMMATAFPDGQWIIDDLIAEDDKVLMRWTFRGTHQGALASIPVPPSGKEIVFSGFSLYRFADDQIIEFWEGYDRFTLLQQLGAIPQIA
jgi:steroid delta-isomerase-like uncharacterized protein